MKEGRISMESIENEVEFRSKEEITNLISKFYKNFYNDFYNRKN